MAGLEACLKAGADVIVNTDADNQYDAACIPALVEPIVAGRAQIVVGARPIMAVREFSLVKKLLQRLGSAVVRIASNTRIPDAPSGFRAMHSDAALRLCVFNNYTYTLETIIQAGRKNIAITSVPVRVNGETRPSRLFGSIPAYVWYSIATILRIATLYRPLRTFATLAATVAVPGFLAILRFVWFYMADDGQGHVQSLAIAGALISVSAILAMGGLIADLVAANRMVLEDIRTRQVMQGLEQARSAAAAGTAPAEREIPRGRRAANASVSLVQDRKRPGV